jgi:hypothetical protein
MYAKTSVSALSIFLIFAPLFFASAASWCTTMQCVQARTAVWKKSCIFECGTNKDAFIVLGGMELGQACKAEGSGDAFCHDATNEDGTKFVVPKKVAETATATASTTTQSDEQKAAAAAQKKAQEEQDRLNERAFQDTYDRFLQSVESEAAAGTGRTTYRTEVPWNRIFGTGTKVDTAKVTTVKKEEPKKKDVNCPDTFVRNFRRPAADPDIKKVQHFLNAHSGSMIAESGPQSKGKETSQFNTAVADAVKKFQVAYFDEVLKAAGEAAPTGFWGPYTRRKANALVCNGVVTLP